MSRTDKTAPLRIQEQDGRVFMRNNGGLWYGIREHARRYNRSERQHARRALRAGRQPEGDQPRGRAKYGFW
jgi:hypothetical protein